MHEKNEEGYFIILILIIYLKIGKKYKSIIG